MRPHRTPSEQDAIDALVATLRKAGSDVVEHPAITDRPDALLLVDGRSIALECRIFTPERILSLHGRTLPDGLLHQLYLPLEPHIWLADTISAKSPKIAEYKRRTGASDAWLLAHSPNALHASLASLYERGLADLFHIAAFQTLHDFQRLYLTGEPYMPPVCIFDAAAPDIHLRRAQFKNKVVRRVAVQRILFAHHMPTVGPDGQGYISSSLFQENQRQILLQPLDKRLRVDYTPVQAIPSHEVAKSEKLSVLYAEPIPHQNKDTK